MSEATNFEEPNQMPKTADFIEETKAQKGAQPKQADSVANNDLTTGKKLGGCTGKGFMPGQSGNLSGRPKRDFAAELAREVIESSYEEAKAGLAIQLKKGNAYTFKELAERGYGKLKEFKEVTHIHDDLSDQDLDGQIERILRLVGTRAEIDALEPARGKAKTNGAAKDHDLLPR